MSNDPFQDLFDREVPRSASSASTRATLDALTPQFRRAKSRRRSRVGAIAAVAILGSTGGAAALGVGPVALNHRPRTDFTGLANSSAVENLPELQDTTVDPTGKTIDSLSSPDIVVDAAPSADTSDANPPDEVLVGPDDTSVETDITGDSNSSSDSNSPSDSSDSSDSGKSEDSSGSDKSSGSDDASKSGDSGGTANSGSSENSGNSGSESGSNASNSNSGSNESSSVEGVDSSSGPDNGTSAPVAGPLTESRPEGSVTVDVNSEGQLELVGQVLPSSGFRYEADLSDHEEIKVKFFSTDTHDEISEVKFQLVDGGITVKVELPSR